MSFKTNCFLLSLVICSAFSAQVMSVRKWRQSEKDSLNKALVLTTEKKVLAALPMFERLLANHPEEEFLKFSYAKCALLAAEKQEEAYRLLGQVYANNKKIPDINFYMAQAAYYNFNFLEALNYITAFLNNKRSSSELIHEANTLKSQIGYARYYRTHSTRSKVVNLESPINSEFDEHRPIITANESLLLYNFAALKSKDSKHTNASSLDFTDNIYLAIKEENQFKTSTLLNDLNIKTPQTAIALSNDGNCMFTYQNNVNDNGDLYISYLKNNQYTTAKKLMGNVNTNYWEGNCSLSPNGKTLYFSSNRPGGYGGSDIYKASLSADSTWVNVQNLGDSINSSLDEDAPFIHPDGKTLFYSSKGFSSMGGYDVFKSHMRTSDSTFRTSENLGCPINSIGDDIYFVISANANMGYYCTQRKEGKGMRDIYSVETDFKNWKPSLCLVKGNTNFRSKAIEAVINIEITTNKKRQYTTIYSKSKSGDYLVSLPTGESYKFIFSAKGYKTQSFEVDLTDISGYLEKTKNISFEVLIDTIKPKAILNDAVVMTKPVIEQTWKHEKVNTEQNSILITPSVSIMKPEKIVEPQLTKHTPTITTLTNYTLSADTKTALAIIHENEIPKKIVKQTASVIQKTTTDIEQNNTVVKKELAKVITSNSSVPIQPQIIKESVIENIPIEKTVAAKKNALVFVSDSLPSAPEVKYVLPVVVPIFLPSKPNIVKKDSIIKPTIQTPTIAETLIENLVVDTVIESTNNLSTPIKLMAQSSVAHVPTLSVIQKNKNELESQIVAEKKSEFNSEKPKEKSVSVKKDNFIPKNHLHEKTMLYIEKYGDLKVDGLEFRVQITAFKNNKSYDFPNLVKFGQIREIHLGDDYTRLEIGGVFKTMRQAFELNKKIVEAGQPEAYVVAVYKGKRYAYEELEFIEVFK